MCCDTVNTDLSLQAFTSKTPENKKTAVNMKYSLNISSLPPPMGNMVPETTDANRQSMIPGPWNHVNESISFLFPP